MSSYFAAIDNGSQSTKVAIIDDTGRVHAAAQQPLRPYDTRDGRVVHPDDDLWDSVRAACRAAVAAFRPGPTRIRAAGLCTIRFCRALLDASGELTEPVISWMDPRLDRPYEPRPEVRHVTTSSGYLGLRLTGERRDTAGNYAGMWPIDEAGRRWSDDPACYAATGMPAEVLFTLVDPGGLIGTLTPDAAAATGLPAGLPVYATSNDKAVEALGSGLRRPSDLLLSLGTYIASMACDTGPARPTGAGAWRNFGAVPGQYLYESDGIRRGMWTVSWFRDLVGETDVAALTAAAARVPPGCGGLFTVLDWLPPADAPFRRGALLGFDGSQGRGAVYRSILEGIALTMAGHRDRLERVLGRRFERLLVSGGGARSPLMLQILADVYALPTARAEHPDGAGLGAAISAAVGCGRFAGWDAAVDAMVRTVQTVDPDPAGVAAYQPLRSAYATLRGHTDALFRDLHER